MWSQSQEDCFFRRKKVPIPLRRSQNQQDVWNHLSSFCPLEAKGPSLWRWTFKSIPLLCALATRMPGRWKEKLLGGTSEQICDFPFSFSCLLEGTVTGSSRNLHCVSSANRSHILRTVEQRKGKMPWHSILMTLMASFPWPSAYLWILLTWDKAACFVYRFLLFTAEYASVSLM